jgi:hypothetical protein
MNNRPSAAEDEYFLKLDAELIKAQRARLDAERKEAERQARYMKCPKCGADLQETDFQHVKVDLCPACKGMWLDAGEVGMIEQVKDSNVGNFLRDLLKGLPRP